MLVQDAHVHDEERSYPPDEIIYRAFYKTRAWKQLSYDIKIRMGLQCQCCGATKDDGVRIITDHIRPVKFYWHLRLEPTNLQVLCEDCNHGKASWDQTDHRGSVEDNLLRAIARALKKDRGPRLKDAITSAHSYGALSQEDAIRLIRDNALESA